MLTKPPVPKALVGAFSVITNLRMELFQALVLSRCGGLVVAGRRDQAAGGGGSSAADTQSAAGLPPTNTHPHAGCRHTQALVQ